MAMMLALGNMLGAANGAGNPTLRSLAIMGDSITAQNSTTNTQLAAIGYAVWARALGGSNFDFEPNGAQLTFGVGGYDSFQVGSILLPLVLASDADTCFVHAGTNDFSDGTTAQAVADELLRIWLELRSGGITPIASTILPVVGNATKSAWIVDANEIIRTHAAANNVKLCDWTNELDVGTDTGVSNTTFLPDNTHPGQTGAAALGRFLETYLAANFRLPFDPWASPGTLVTRNPSFAGSAGQPTSWNAPVVPSGGTLNSKTLVADSETGGNWWQLDITQGSATANFSVQLDFTAQPSIVGSNVYAIFDCEVVSGTILTVQGRASVTNNAYDILAGSLTNTASITSADGVLTLRTPVVAVPGGNSYYTPFISFSGTGVVRFRRAALYSV